MQFEKIDARRGRAALKMGAALLVAFALFCGLFAGRLMWGGAVDIGFAKPYILSALKDKKSGTYVTMDQMILQWPDVNGPLLLGMKNSRVYGPEGRVIASIDEAALGLHKGRLLIGQISPTVLILKSPTLRVIRRADNSFDVGLDQGVESQSPVATPDRNPLETLFAILADPEKSDGPSFLKNLRTVQIDAAKMVVDDRTINMSWTVPRLDLKMERRKGGVQASSVVMFEEGKLNPPTLRAEIVLDGKSGKMSVDALLEHFKISLLASRIPELFALKNHLGLLDARLEMQMAADHTIEDAKFTLLSGSGELNIPALSDKPVRFSDVGLLAEYEGTSGDLAIKAARATINRSVNIKAGGGVHFGDGGFKGPVRVSIDKLAQAEIGPLWPMALKGEAAETWIVHRLSDGTFSNVFAQLDLQGTQDAQGWHVVPENVTAGFAFEDMKIDYRAPLEPVTHAKGKGAFDLRNETLHIAVEKANLLDMDIEKADLNFTHIIEAGKGLADVKIKIKGPVKSALTYVQAEPIAVKTTIDVKNAKGLADLDVNLDFPTHPDVKVEDVKIGVKGTLSDVSLPRVVKDLTLSGGPLAVEIADNVFEVKGKALLEGRETTLAYQEFLSAQGKAYTSKLTAGLIVDPNIRARMGVDLSEFLEGSAPVDLIYTTYKDKKSVADVHANLRDARLFFDPFGYEKPMGEDGSATFKAVLQDGYLKEIKDLKGSASRFSMTPSVLTFRQKGGETQLSGGRIPHFEVNETKAALDFNVTPSGQYVINLKGPFLDFQALLDDKDETTEPYTAPPLKIAVDVAKMRTTDSQVVQNVKISADIDGQGAFNGFAVEAHAGAGDLTARYEPDAAGKRSFHLEATDAGAALKAFGVYDNIVGGKMVINGEPIRGILDRNLKGRAEITDFKVVKAPALARLLGVMSLPGVAQLLNNEGLSFTKLEAKFDWLFRPQGSLLVLRDGRTSGNSLGLTFDGTFDNAAKTVDVTGTIIPLSGINKIIGNIPLIGNIVTGGTGSLIAATYTMKGPMEDPKTSVNPLSILTPGVLRRILFE